MMERNLKLGLAALLFICLLDMPYGYYELVRFVAAFSFGYLGFRELGQKNQNLAYLYFALAFLFQPFFKIALGREIWNMVDAVAGIGLVVSALKGKPEKGDTAG